MEASITVIIFNRPEHTARLRELLRSAESRELFVVSDGPRPDKPGESENVDACRNIFADWPGTAHFLFAAENMGCKDRVSSGLNWVFEKTDRTIVLEDDLTPHPTFFNYCDRMLELYFDDSKIMSICGSKIYPHQCLSQIFFSRYANSWGWATWKRAWSCYDDKFTDYSSAQIFSIVGRFLGSYRASFYWLLRLHQVRSGSVSSWFYCWLISCFLKEGVHIYPGSNLVVNNGYGDDSTHTARQEPYMPVAYGPPFPLLIAKPADVSPYEEADAWIDDNMYSKSLPVRLSWVMKKLMN